MSDDQLRNQRTEFDDLQAELAGIPNGKQARFLDDETSPRGLRNRESNNSAASQILQNELQRRLQDADYARLWNEANDAFDTLQSRLTNLTDQLAQRIEHLEGVVNDLEESTARTSDGGLVFRDPQGRLVDAEGNPLSPEEAAKVENPEDAQSYDQYRNAKDALNAARSKQDRYADIQRDVTRWKDELNDPDNPLDRDQIEKVLKDADAYRNEIDASQQITRSFNPAAEAVVLKASEAVKPEIEILAP